MTFTATGPPDEVTMATGNEDEYVSMVRQARVFVTYVAVVHDRSVFVRSIDPLPGTHPSA